MTSRQIRGPLDGVTVLETGTGRAGAFAGAILADLGADVVTTAALPDPVRRRAFDRGKRTGTLTAYDVLLDEGGTTPPGFRGVHCSITPYGAAPVAATPAPDPDAEDLMVQALSGNMDLTGEAGAAPFEAGIPLADLGAGIYAAIGVLGALWAASTTRVEVAKIDVAVALLSYMGVGYFADGDPPSRVGTGHSTIFPYNAFRAADGEVVAAPFTARFWHNFCIAIGREDLTEGDTYRSFRRRLARKDELTAIFEPIMATRRVDEWVERFRVCDVPGGPVLGVPAALELEQTVARGMVRTIDDDGTPVRTVGSPFRFRRSDGEEYTPTLERVMSPQRAPDPAPAGVMSPQRAPDPAPERVMAPQRAGRPTSDSVMAPQREVGGAGPLAGVRVLDLTRMFAGPCATEVLGDLGAEVIKVEEPRIGDPTRRNLPMWEGGDQAESAYFMSLNRGKRSVCLDLKTDEGRDALLELAGTCDVLVENYRPGVMDRLGLGAEAMLERFPRLVHCSLSGFGATGPARDKISFDLVNQAMAGMIDLTGDPGDRPVRIGVPIGDMAGGLYLAAAALAGLRGRERTGRGCSTDLALHDVLITLLSDVAQRWFDTGVEPTRTGGRDRDVAPRGCYRVADGWLVLSAVTGPQWTSLCDVLGWADDGSDATGRKAEEAALDARLTAALARRTAAEWTDALTAAGVPAAPVRSLAQALESPLVVERGIVFDAEHPAAGPVRNLASPLVLDGVRAGVGGTSPLLGADTDAILGAHSWN